MKIILNAYQHSKHITGTDRMAFNYLYGLQKIDSSNKYIVVCSNEEYILSCITSDNFTIIKPRKINNALVSRIYGKLWRELLDIRLYIKKADVYFSFHNMQTPKFRIARRIITSNLDLIPLVFKEYGDIAPKVINRIKNSAKKSDYFVSISNFSKNELIKVLSIESDDIAVIQLAADKHFEQVSKLDINVPKKYILTIGGSEPRKRVKDVITAFKNLPSDIRQEYHLVIAGGNWHGKKLEGINDVNIKYLGYVNDADLPALYQNASVFVFASEYEGFGFAILEAMKSKTPVINAIGTSLDEVAGTATLKFKTGDIKNLTKQIRTLLLDKGLQKDLVSKGTEQSDSFSWEKSTKKLHKLLTNNKSSIVD